MSTGNNKNLDVEVPTNEASLSNLFKNALYLCLSNFCSENETRQRPQLLGQVMRTIG